MGLINNNSRIALITLVLIAPPGLADSMLSSVVREVRQQIPPRHIDVTAGMDLPVGRDEPPRTIWSVQVGDDLKQLITEWAVDQGYYLDWKAGEDRIVARGPLLYHATGLVPAVSYLFDALPADVGLRYRVADRQTPPYLIVYRELKP